ncbi:MAG: PUA domain-containing protein [Candidatus Korarchaeota archaeon]
MARREKVDRYLSIYLNKHLSYYFGKKISLDFTGCEVEYSSTGKVKYVYKDGKLVLVINPADGSPAIQPAGIELFADVVPVIVVDDPAVEFIKKGKSLFCKHVVDAPLDLSPNMEVLLKDKSGIVIGVGRAMVDGKSMRHLIKGVAVKVRRGLVSPEEIADEE